MIKLTEPEFYIGMLLNDDDFLEKQRIYIDACYQDDRVNKIAAILKRDRSDNYFIDIYLIDKMLCVYAMKLSNFVARHNINQKARR